MVRSLSGGRDALMNVVVDYVRQLIIRYHDDDLAAMSAQVTYYLILAFFPFLFFLLHVLSFTPLPQRLLMVNINLLLPTEAAALVRQIVEQTVQAKSAAALALGMLTSLWAASRGMAALVRGLNHSYGVKEDRRFFGRNLVAFLAIIGLSGMIVLSFVMVVLGRVIGAYVFSLAGDSWLFYAVWYFVRYGITLALMLVTFYLLYRYLPNRRLPLRHLVAGTLFTTLGWVAASLVFSFCVNNFIRYELVYGSLGGIFALIVWLYMSTLIFLLGGEMNAISYDFDRHGRR